MMSRKAWLRIHAVYDHVHAALWAMLFVFVIYAVVFVTPQLLAAEVALTISRHRILQLKTALTA